MLLAFAFLLACLNGCVSTRTDMTDAIARLEPQEKDAPAKASEDKTAKPDADKAAKPASGKSPTENPNIGAVPPPPPQELPPLVGSATSVGGPLTLVEVLTSVEQHYPLLQAIEQERAVAGGRLLSTMGAFDFNLVANANGQGTTYSNFGSGVGFNQLLPTNGVNFAASYRNGYGEFPTYNLGQKTADGGEFRTSLNIPLLRDRAIDRPRAAIQQARLDVAIAEPMIERLRLDFHRAAARTYWSWVASGQRLKVSESLVKLAADRDEQLEARVKGGATANFERVDNQQNIALRNVLLVQAQRAFQQATIELSLFLRDDTGSPTLAGENRLPEFPDIQPIDVRTFEAALRTAFDNRPELKRLRLQRDKIAVDFQLATNQAMPSLNAVVGATQDVGRGKSSLTGPNSLDRTTVSAGVALLLPVQQREARGRVLVAQAQTAQIDRQLRQAEDVVRADVQDVFSALERAYEYYQQAKKRVELAKLVADGERESFRLSRSDILRVTLRELAAFEAEILLLTAQFEYFRAQADYFAATGTRESR